MAVDATYLAVVRGACRHPLSSVTSGATASITPEVTPRCYRHPLAGGLLLPLPATARRTPRPVLTQSGLTLMAAGRGRYLPAVCAEASPKSAGVTAKAFARGQDREESIENLTTVDASATTDARNGLSRLGLCKAVNGLGLRPATSRRMSGRCSRCMKRRS